MRRDRNLDRALRRALGLTEGQEDALWEGFLRRATEEREAWQAFAGAMAFMAGVMRSATSVDKRRRS